MQNANPDTRMSDSTPGFTLVTTDEIEANTLSEDVKRKAELYDYTSQNSSINHTLCDEWVDYFLEQIEKQLKQNEHTECLMKLEDIDDFIPNIDKLTRDLVDLKDQEQALLNELEKLQIDEDELKKIH